MEGRGPTNATCREFGETVAVLGTSIFGWVYFCSRPVRASTFVSEPCAGHLNAEELCWGHTVRKGREDDPPPGLRSPRCRMGRSDGEHGQDPENRLVPHAARQTTCVRLAWIVDPAAPTVSKEAATR